MFIYSFLLKPTVLYKFKNTELCDTAKLFRQEGNENIKY